MERGNAWPRALFNIHGLNWSSDMCKKNCRTIIIIIEFNSRKKMYNRLFGFFGFNAPIIDKITFSLQTSILDIVVFFCTRNKI